MLDRGQAELCATHPQMPQSSVCLMASLQPASAAVVTLQQDYFLANPSELTPLGITWSSQTFEASFPIFIVTTRSSWKIPAS